MEEIVFPEEKYIAVYDPESGQLKQLGQDWAFPDEKYCIPVEKHFVESVFSGETKLFKCYVDFESGKIEIAELENIIKIDDVLHRVPLKEYSNVLNPDILITYYKKSQKLNIELNSELGGTKIYDEKQKIKRNVIWSGDTDMNFYITAFNDPHILYTVLTTTLEELREQSFERHDIILPENFSIYTRRLLKNYICEII